MDTSHTRAGPCSMPSDVQRSGNATVLYGGTVTSINTALQPRASDAWPSNPPPAASSSSSKSALTIALQRARSAVLLDSAHNYPAAITAYAQAVRLLRQVLARVEEGSRDMQRKRSTAGESGPRDGETPLDWERRKERYERKEKAKMDEARRLKVIHDTYQDRIRMLVQMGETLGPAPSPSSATSPLSHHQHQRRPSSPSPSPSSSPLPFSDPTTTTTTTTTTNRPHPYSAAAAAAATASSSSSSTLTTSPNTSQLRRGTEGDGDGDGHGIGAAMLELARGPSPTSISTLTLPYHREGFRDDDDDDDDDDSSRVQRGAGGGGGRRRATEPVLLLERLPVVVASPSSSAVAGEDKEAASSSPSFATAAPESTSPRYGNDHLLSSSPRPRRRSSFASDSTATATGIGTGRDDVEPVPPHHLAPRTPSSPPAVAPPMRRGASVGALPMSPASSFGSRSASASGSRSRAGSAASPRLGGSTSPPSSSFADGRRAPDMQRGYSTGSIGGGGTADTPPLLLRRRGSSSIGIGGLAYIEEGPVRAAPTPPPPPTPGEMARPRPTRGASLGGGGGSSGSGSGSGLGLVNSTTVEGTISQRRQTRTTTPSPQPGEGEEEFLAATAARYDDADDFGRPTDSARHESFWTTGSLPTRLRAESRSLLPLEWQTSTVAEAEAEEVESSLPPLPKQQPPPPPPPLEISPTTKRRVPSSSSSSTSYHHHHRPSTSTSSFGTSAGGGGGGPSRKGSVPTPTSLTAPSLGRSTSASSSIASNASSSFPPPLRRRRSSAAAAAARRTPLSAATAAATGIYLSAGLAHPPPDASSPASRETALSIPPPRRPFHLMRLVLATMMSSSPTSTGGYISEKLFLPSAIWRTNSGGGGAATKLVALETKVRMLDLLSNGLDGVDKAGRGLLLVPIESANARAVARQEADRFARELDSFEGLAEGVQSTLAKKLGPGVVVVAGGGTSSVASGRKGSAASFASWSSKLSHSLNRVTNGNSLVDSQAAYVDAIAKVFKHAQCIDQHLAAILQGARSPDHDSPYDLLDRNLRLHVERYLRRCSEFFGHVVCRFVLQDVGVLLDKYVKRGGAWLSAD